MSENGGMTSFTSKTTESSDPGQAPNMLTLARLVGMALIIATLCNGAGFYLRKIGLIEPDAYRAYWPAHCESMSAVGRPEAVGRGCCANATTSEFMRMDSHEQRLLERPIISHLYALSKTEFALKLVKDLLGMALIGVSAVLIAKRISGWNSLRETWPLQLLLGYVLLSLLFTWTAHGTMTAVAGLRPFLFIAIALTCGWLAPHLPFIAKCIAILLVTELLLVPAEMLYGIHLHGHIIASMQGDLYSLAKRASGTLVLPNSMGVFAVSALAFYYAFSPTRAFFAQFTIIALVLVYASGSGMGIVSAILLLFLVVFERIGAQKRTFLAVASILTAIALILTLPGLVKRPDLFESVGGRLEILRSAVANRSTPEVLFGRGVGLNTNAALNLTQHTLPDATNTVKTFALQQTDSTVIGLIIQIGLLGTMIFYGGILWAALRDPPSRTFYTIVTLCSLTINITELFPVNFLIGFALAHSMSSTRHD